MITSILAFIFTLTLLVFVHEFGHFVVARINGVRVETFSVGFGKAICGYTDKHGTRWQLSMIPFGGYVKMFGDTNEASVETQDQQDSVKLTEEEKKFTYTHKKPLQKIAISFAGPLFNFLLAIVIMTLYLMYHGTIVPSTDPIGNTISGVMENSPAEKIHLQAKDQIVSINNIPIRNYKELGATLKNKGGKTVDLKYKRNAQVFTSKITLDNLQGDGRLGVYVSNGMLKKFSFFQSVKYASIFSYHMSTTILVYLKDMFHKNPDISQVGGPIKIAQLSGDAVRQGMATLWYFIAMLSINLGVMNLLPLPVLDGGNIVLSLIELISGRNLNQKILIPITYGAVALLVTVMILTTIKDLFGLFK